MSSTEPVRSPLTPEQVAERASSFGGVASHYSRFRPGPPAAAIDWLLPRHVSRVVDLGAGTGGLTRGLMGRADEVVAVEPDDRMREVLTESLPEVRALAGTGESMPLSDSCADAVFASSSWHWMDLVPTLHEVGRVLVPGGILGVMWSGPDRQSEFVQQALALLGGEGGHAPPDERNVAELRAAWQNPYGNEQILTIPAGVPFDQPETNFINWEVALTADELVGLLGTFSWVILMEDEDRARLFETARQLLRDALGVHGDVTVDVGYRCEVWRARRH
jgi:SAM-dependent methyltransferase